MRIILCTLIIALFFGCSKDSPTDPTDNTPTEDASFFFPLSEGNIWYYYEQGQSGATQSRRVWSSFTQDDTTYVLLGNKEATADTLHQDKWGRVYKRFNGKNLLWLDFSVDDGDTYEYKLSEKINYSVTVSRRLAIEYDDQKFEGCIKFEFEVPDINSANDTYILAPDIGIVQRIGAWNTKYLKNWQFQ